MTQDTQTITPEFNEWLHKQGWNYEKYVTGPLYKCRICHRYTTRGYHSPKFAFYHEICLFQSARGKKLLKQFEKEKEL